jgi:hypothetical protein
MKRLTSCVLLAVFLLELPMLAGIDGKSAMYVGGTLKVKEMTEGKSSTSDEKEFIFEYKEGKQLTKVKIAYERIDSLEYGQKAGRRLGLAIAITPLALFSKKRKHFLTLGYKDSDDKQQAAVFELGKDIVRTTLASLEARTGRKIEYQDEEARKSGKGN